MNKRKYCFILHIAELWISLPQDVVGEPSLCRYRNQWTKSWKSILSDINKCKIHPFCFESNTLLEARECCAKCCALHCQLQDVGHGSLMIRSSNLYFVISFSGLRWKGDAALFPALWKPITEQAPALQLRWGNWFSRLSMLKLQNFIS